MLPSYDLEVTEGSWIWGIGRFPLDAKLSLDAVEGLADAGLDFAVDGLALEVGRAPAVEGLLVMGDMF
jgi:hypothetical protein